MITSSRSRESTTMKRGEDVVEIPIVRMGACINDDRQHSEQTHNMRLAKSECSTRYLQK
jgi:hypothetical protein